MNARMTWYGLLAALASTVAITGCNSSTNVTPGPCGGVSGPVALVYPAPNSTAIPANLPGIVFGSTTPLTAGYQALLVPAASGVTFPFATVQNAPSPLPSPNAIPSFANPVYQFSGLLPGSTLPSASVINVYLNDLGSNCNPYGALLGSFTTR